MTRILVATDGSDGSNRALDYAAQKAKNEGAELLIVNVASYELPDKVLVGFTEGQNAWFTELLESVSSEVLTEARRRALAAGAPSVLIRSAMGDIATKILQVAQDNDVSAIVVGKRGSGRIKGLLLGSVSQKLVSMSPLPVTVVP